MIYYKVKKDYDNFVYSKNNDFFIENELYTEKEIEKIKNKFIKKYPRSQSFYDIFDIVEINKNKTYFFFGARFVDPKKK